MQKYFKVGVNGEEEITREQAKECLAKNYEEREATFDEMLDMNEYIPCMFYGIEIRDEE